MNTASTFVFFMLITVSLFLVTINPIESVLWLMLTLATFALFLAFFELPFFGAALVILYVSAITVLFIFVILMTPANTSSTANFVYYVYPGALMVAATSYFLRGSPSTVHLPAFNSLFLDINESVRRVEYSENLFWVGSFTYTSGSLYFIVLTLIFFVTLLSIRVLRK